MFEGNLFATGPGGVCVIAPDGTLLGDLTGDRTATVLRRRRWPTLFVSVQSSNRHAAHHHQRHRM